MHIHHYHHHLLSLKPMASFVSQLSHVLFLLFLASSSLQSQGARESRFFSKTTRSQGPNKPSTAPDETPAATGSEQPAKLPPQSHNGYGLYGHGVSMNSNANNFNPAFPKKDNAFNGAQFSNANDGHSKSPNDHEEFFGGASYEHNEPNLVWPNGIHDDEQNGMSDTRFSEKGRYFYQPYGPAREYPERYRSRDGAGARGTTGNYRNEGYGRFGHGDEYSNAMGRYPTRGENQENYPEEYVNP